MERIESIELDFRCLECGHESVVLVPEYSCVYVDCGDCGVTLKVQHEWGFQRSVGFR